MSLIADFANFWSDEKLILDDDHSEIQIHWIISGQKNDDNDKNKDKNRSRFDICRNENFWLERESDGRDARMIMF